MKNKFIPASTLIAGVFIAVSFFSSCNKDDENDNTPSSKTALLSAHSWVMADFLINDTTFFSFIPTCEKDNRFTFTAMGTFTEDEGPTKCSPTDPQVVSTGPWSFANNETRLIIAPGTADEMMADIDRLDADTFIVSMTSYDSTFATTTVIKQVFSR